MALHKELIAIALLDSSARSAKGVSGLLVTHSYRMCCATLAETSLFFIEYLYYTTALSVIQNHWVIQRQGREIAHDVWNYMPEKY